MIDKWLARIGDGAEAACGKTSAGWASVIAFVADPVLHIVEEGGSPKGVF